MLKFTCPMVVDIEGVPTSFAAGDEVPDNCPHGALESMKQMGQVADADAGPQPDAPQPEEAAEPEATTEPEPES